MEKYISKAAVVSEIKSLMSTTFTNFDEGVNAATKTLLESIDAFETKEDVTNTDAFIKKACEWLEPVLEDLAGYNCAGDLIGYFKKYMEGE